MEKFLKDLFGKESEALSPYRFSQILGKLAGKKLPPQMIYNYINKGYIEASRGATDKWEISHEEAIVFSSKYLRKNAPEFMKTNNFS